MSSRPNIKPGDWIHIGSVKAVVAAVREPGDSFGDCEVVFRPDKPTNHDVEWVDGKWQFAKRPDCGGYAEKYPRLRQYVDQLKRG